MPHRGHFSRHLSIRQQVCQSVCLTCFAFAGATRIPQMTCFSKRQRLHILHAYSAYKILPYNTNINDLVTLTVTLMLKNLFFTSLQGLFVARSILIHIHLLSM